ncbi:hypothetical protein GGI20_004893 [Coemansia sp. BCRC 34301]|nr:hypothetical protein GGI20_004893 [Coemansia sp. BCRC 34301]
MAYRKRSLDLPASDESPASIKQARSSTSTSTSSSTRPPLTITTALGSPNGEYQGTLPPIRSLTGAPLTSPAIPSFRHFHAPPGLSGSPPSARHQPDVHLGLTSSLSQLSHTRTQIHPPQGTYPPSGPYGHPPSVHYTYAPRQSQPPPPPPAPPPYRSHAEHHGSSPVSSTQSAGSPHLARQEIRGEAGMDVMDGLGGSAPEAVKVARNWSRDETLSLVRAIKRHYEALKRCKTNQERSNIWHRIHKEHSSQFPGRSKKASQDRWGKVLSDYKDVMVHNKEKGAARWTFDFFKEVAGIIDGDAQFMDSALSPPSSSATTATASSVGRPPPTDDLNSYSFGVASSSIKSVGSSEGSGPPSASAGPMPLAHHRMSEPNLALVASTSKHDPRHMSHHNRPPQSPHARHAAVHVSSHQYRPHVQQMSAAAENVQSLSLARYSPPRRTSYPQLPHQQRILQSQQLAAQQAAAAGRAAGRGAYHTFRYYPQLSAAPPATSAAAFSQRIHSWAPASLSVPVSEGEGDPAVDVLGGGDPDETCQMVLDILAKQLKQIDAEQSNLARLKESTQNAMNKVEQILQMYSRPPPPPGESE